MKVTNPCLSFEACGQIGNIISFRKLEKRLNTASLKSDPVNPNTAAQQAQRLFYSAGVSYWRSRADAQARAALNKLARYTRKYHNGYTLTMAISMRSIKKHGSAFFPVSAFTINKTVVVLKMVDVSSGNIPPEHTEAKIFCGVTPQGCVLAGSVYTNSNGNLVIPGNFFADKNFFLIKINNEYASGLYERAKLEDQEMSLEPVGVIKYAVCDITDDYWLKANGASLKQADYPDLFAKIGTMFGTGSGEDTFSLPDLSARAVLGGVPDGVYYAATTGAPSGGLSVDENVASHSHSIDNAAANHSHGATAHQYPEAHNHSFTTGNQSASHTHEGVTENENNNHGHSYVTGYQSTGHTHDGYTGYTAPNHRHSISSDGSHSHTSTIKYVLGGAAGTARATLDSNGTGIYNVTSDSKGAHDHADYTGYENPNHRHAFSSGYQSASHNHSGFTNAQDAHHSHLFTSDVQSASHNHSGFTDPSSTFHTHDVYSADAEHSHTMQDASTSHGHTVSGWDSVTRPAHILLYPFIKVRSEV